MEASGEAELPSCETVRTQKELCLSVCVGQLGNAEEERGGEDPPVSKD